MPGCQEYISAKGGVLADLNQVEARFHFDRKKKKRKKKLEERRGGGWKQAGWVVGGEEGIEMPAGTVWVGVGVGGGGVCVTNSNL